MVSKRVLSVLALSAIASANVLPLHPRAEASPAPTDMGIVLNNVAALLPDEAMISELEAAATSLMEAFGQPGYDKMADEYLSSYLSILDANNDPASASQWASGIVSLLEASDEIPKEVAEPYSSLISNLQNSQVAGNSADIVKQLINFITQVRSIMPEMFEDVPQDVGNSNSSSADIKSTPVIEDNSDDETPSSATEKDDAASEESDLSSDDADNESETDSDSSSGASTNGRIAFGFLSAGIAVSVMTSLF
ncbi:hypothetical protein H4R99_001500 [Coemansia sp. RSA 1722]|nr:hypothetical protein LPJ57_001825 [Coemansia sp. RSA 486]KAJ2236326.1 hypothetical protein IWW45_001869 [Coemansia sp. RSA 485]KAJ2598797.1 hypothetical protein GGF39_002504 [Coemansia sp. RSA 1721]KAJ2604922.1 hypothetical protein H4R99_001500 [Coemansia sp. RSA 1722]KAJ2638753.1 hypothetical protein GGF40_001412 [Coemansia sp. RSA 1286]